MAKKKEGFFVHSFTQVLHLEQLLTTGGGWQDQCGGLYGGVKVSRSYKGLPVKIYTEQLDLSQELFDKLERHLLLVYTGVTRLARNLLQVCTCTHSSKGFPRNSEYSGVLVYFG